MSKEAKGLAKRALILGPMIASYFMSLGFSNASEYVFPFFTGFLILGMVTWYFAEKGHIDLQWPA